MARRFRAVQIVLGVFLLGTAGLKLYGLSVSAVPRVGWFAQPWVQLAAVEWELVLGQWLLSGSYPRGAWLAALATFTAFAAVSGYLGWVGVASCGCFGVIKASPWWVFGVDVTVVISLILLRPGLRLPEKPRPQSVSRMAREAVILSVGAAVVLGLLGGIGAWRYGTLDAALAHLRGERVSVRPGFVDVGSGVPGQTVQATVVVVNRTDRRVRIIGGTSDCSCVTTDDLPITLESGESRAVSIRVRLPGSPGLFNRYATFWTDDDRARAVVFPLTGKIELAAQQTAAGSGR